VARGNAGTGRLVSAGDGVTAPSSLLLRGPPGTGKTTLTYVVSQVTDREFMELFAVTAG
jgi:putative ATPase